MPTPCDHTGFSASQSRGGAALEPGVWGPRGHLWPAGEGLRGIHEERTTWPVPEPWGPPHSATAKPQHPEHSDLTQGRRPLAQPARRHAGRAPARTPSSSAWLPSCARHRRSCSENKSLEAPEEPRKAERSGFQGLLTVAGVRKDTVSLIPGHS